MSDTYIGADNFSATVEQLFGKLSSNVDREAMNAVRKSVQVGRKEVIANATALFPPKSSNPYATSWKTKTKKTLDGPEGVIYSKKPGLPHLLEKGHATLAGGRVPGRVHIAPAAEDTFKKAEELFGERIEDALRETNI